MQPGGFGCGGSQSWIAATAAVERTKEIAKGLAADITDNQGGAEVSAAQLAELAGAGLSGFAQNLATAGSIPPSSD